MPEQLQKTFLGSKVLITGHTGFKGSWLSIWLSKMGAKVTLMSDKGICEHLVRVAIKEDIYLLGLVTKQ